jgi:Zn-dependent peptidase ImmA (M78 family)
MASSTVSSPTAFSEALTRLFRGRCAARALAQRATVGASGPVQPEQVAEQLGIRIVWEDICAQAQYRVQNGTPVIVLNRSYLDSMSSSAQQRFVLAHEIGHHMLREEIKEVWPRFVFSSDDPLEETLCDRFAAELLMPAPLMASELRRTELLPHRLLDLAKQYGVTLEAVLLRAVELLGAIVRPIIWARDGAQWCVRWTANPRERQVLFCDTGRTPIERSFETLQPQAGTADLLFDGKRQRFATVALRLRNTSTVVSLFTTSSQIASHWEPYRMRQKDIRTERVVRQPKFAFARHVPANTEPRLRRYRSIDGASLSGEGRSVSDRRQGTRESTSTCPQSNTPQLLSEP